MPKHAGQIIGAFVFRNEGDGCFTSKYHHGDSDGSPFVEACKLIRRHIVTTDPFIGTFRTIWIQDGNIGVTAELIINNHSRANLYELLWRDMDTSIIIFRGTAMLFGELLVGTYWDE